MASVALTDFDSLTFDCYGTLIDWERGILAAAHEALDPALARASAHVDDERLLEL